MRDRVGTGSGGYRLRVEAGECDRDRAQRLIDEGQAALSAGSPDRAAESFAAALQLWRGEPLADLAYESFAQAEIGSLQELRLLAADGRIDAELALGADAQLVPELERRLEQHPYRERVASQLMIALYRSGRQADALSVYQRVRARLADELGLEPGPELRELEHSILQQQAGLTAEAADVADVPARAEAAALPVSPTATIGREHEVDALSRLLCRADVHLVTLVGPGGVGKTRLALTAARAIELHFSDGACWVELASVAREEHVGFTIAQALDVTPVRGRAFATRCVACCPSAGCCW